MYFLVFLLNSVYCSLPWRANANKACWGWQWLSCGLGWGGRLGSISVSMGSPGRLTTCSSTSRGSLLVGSESGTKLVFISSTKDILWYFMNWLIIEFCHLAKQCGNAKIAHFWAEPGNYEKYHFIQYQREKEKYEKYHFIEYIIGNIFWSSLLYIKVWI